jgi:hypothetical protein
VVFKRLLSRTQFEALYVQLSTSRSFTHKPQIRHSNSRARNRNRLPASFSVGCSKFEMPGKRGFFRCPVHRVSTATNPCLTQRSLQATTITQEHIQTQAQGCIVPDSRNFGNALQKSLLGLTMACNILTFFTGLLGLSSTISSPFSYCISESNHAARDAVYFEIHLTAGKVNPTGTGFRDAILINGTFTGPTLHVERGDNVEFLVRNYLREDTSIHFHGIAQGVSPWADGTPGVSQRPIRPGASYLYRWQAEESGVFFYHAHSRGQLMDGMYGAIIINPSDDEETPFRMLSRDSDDWEKMRHAERKMQTLMISDWSQYNFKDFMKVEERANIDYTCMDAIIVNGAVSLYHLEKYG